MKQYFLSILFVAVVCPLSLHAAEVKSEFSCNQTNGLAASDSANTYALQILPLEKQNERRVIVTKQVIGSSADPVNIFDQIVNRDENQYFVTLSNSASGFEMTLTQDAHLNLAIGEAAGEVTKAGTQYFLQGYWDCK